jgi:transposase
MPRKSYTKEFKVQAVKLVVEQGMSGKQVCQDLGVSYSALVRWLRENRSHGKDAFPGKGKLMPQDEQVRLLERDVRRLTIERDILKKTIGYFAEKP